MSCPSPLRMVMSWLFMCADWKNNLNKFFGETEQPANRDMSEMAAFITDVVIPAFEEIGSEMRNHGRTATMRTSETSAGIMIQKGGQEELSYWVQGRALPAGILPYAEIRFKQRKGRRFITVESVLRNSPNCKLCDITRDDVVSDFVKAYTSRVDRS